MGLGEEELEIVNALGVEELNGQINSMGVYFFENVEGKYFELVVVFGGQERDHVAHQILLDEKLLHHFVIVYQNQHQNQRPLSSILHQRLEIVSQLYLNLTLHQFVL